jgi:hypothetical protein
MPVPSISIASIPKGRVSDAIMAKALTPNALQRFHGAAPPTLVRGALRLCVRSVVSSFENNLSSSR